MRYIISKNAAFLNPTGSHLEIPPASLLFNKLKRSKSSSVTDASEIHLRCTPTPVEVGNSIPSFFTAQVVFVWDLTVPCAFTKVLLDVFCNNEGEGGGEKGWR